MLTGSEREALQSYARSRSLPHALVCRAKIVLMSADGHNNTAIAETLGVSAPVIALSSPLFSFSYLAVTDLSHLIYQNGSMLDGYGRVYRFVCSGLPGSAACGVSLTCHGMSVRRHQLSFIGHSVHR